MWGRLTIRQKTLLLFAAVALVPLLLINLIWLRSSQNSLKKAAAERQAILASSSAEQVDQFIAAKIDNAIIHSQIQSVRDFDIEQARLNLLEYAKQDGDLERISLVDTSGQEQIVLNRLEFDQKLNDVKDSDAFRVVTFLSGKEYIGPVRYVDNQPRVTLAVPLISFVSRQGGSDLSTAEAGIRRGSGDIKGALIVELSLNNLWQSVLSAKLGASGYAYLVDDKGNLIAYPQPEFLSSHQNLRGTPAVDMAIQSLGSQGSGQVSQPAQTVSESGVAVLSSHALISRTRWAVIAEEPISSVYGEVNRVALVALLLFVGSAGLAIALILLSSRGIVKPIRQLTNEALRLGGGDFSHPIKSTSHDELGTLATTFNQMGTNLADLIKRYEQRNLDLAAERTKLRAVLDTIADAVLALDQNYHIVLANRTAIKLAGQPSARMVGQPWLKLFPLVLRGETVNNQLLETDPYIRDLTLKAAAGEQYLDLAVVKLTDDPSGITYILTIHNVTQSRQLEVMKLDFVSMAAHELRTPLTAVLGYLHLISDGRQLSGESQTHLQRALSTSVILEGLINNLLSLSKIERGALTLKKQPLELNEIIKAEVENQQLPARDKQLKLSYQPANQPLWIEGDALAIREVVANLIANAIHYTDPGDSIAVDSHATKDAISFSVADTGIGIPAEAIPKLFTKYYRVRSGLTSGSAGTGIGLFICKSIVELHNGTISVNSREGKGSIFTVSLPVGTQPEATRSKVGSHTKNLTG